MAQRFHSSAVFDASPNPYMVLDRELRYVAANPAYLAVTSRQLEDLLGRRITEVFPHDPDDPLNASARRLVASLDQVFATGQPSVLPSIHYRIRVGDGADAAWEDRYWSATHTPLFDETGAVAFVLQNTVNITELTRIREYAASAEQQHALMEAGVLSRANAVQRQNEALDQDLHRLRTIFDQAPAFMCFLRGPEHVYELVNAEYERLVGRRDLVGRPVREALPELDEEFHQLLQQVYETGRAFVGRGMTAHLVGESGQLEAAVVDFVYQPVVDARQKTLGIFVLGNDITQQHRSEAQRQRLYREVEAMARVLNATRDFVGISDPHGAPTFVNQAGLELMGFPDLEAARAVPVVEYFVERQREFVSNEVLPAAVARNYWEGELHFKQARTGEEIPVLYSVFPLRDASSALVGLATITRDLRAQKVADAERAELLEKERRARALAEEANLLKDQFLATVSHELRTPLTSILGWMHMLRGGLISESKRAHALEVVERNARVQAQLIDDLLDVSRIISGKLALEFEPTDVAAIVSAAVETIRPAARAKGVDVQVALEWSGSLVGDSRRLQQVLWNLLANAVKFTPSGGAVNLRAERSAAGLTLTVSDSGEGIAPEFLPHVFERFRQAEGGMSRNQGGLGLGLSIVRHVVEAHGGSVSAQSAGRGQGATFTVRLPVSLSPYPQPTQLQRDVLEIPPVLDGMHILVVDDEEDTREYVRTLLERCRARVSVRSNARDALDAIASERPDLLVSDLGMPGKDGYELIRAVRALPDRDCAHTPAVALTAYARSEDRTRAMLAGYQNYVTKPVEPREFLAVLGSVVRPRRA